MLPELLLARRRKKSGHLTVQTVSNISDIVAEIVVGAAHTQRRITAAVAVVKVAHTQRRITATNVVEIRGRRSNACPPV